MKYSLNKTRINSPLKKNGKIFGLTFLFLLVSISALTAIPTSAFMTEVTTTKSNQEKSVTTEKILFQQQQEKNFNNIDFEKRVSLNQEESRIEKVADILDLQFNDFDIKYPYVFLACGGDGLKIVDVSNDTNPVIIYENDSLPELKKIKLDGDLLLTFNFFTYLIFNISNVNSPELITAKTISLDIIFDGKISGNYVYLLYFYDGLTVYELSNNSLNPLTNYNEEDYHYSEITVCSGLIFLTSGYSSKITILNQTDIHNLSVLLTYANKSEKIISTFYTKSNIYLTMKDYMSETFFFKIIGLENNYSSFREMSKTQLNDTIFSIYVNNETAYLLSEGILYLYNVSNPETPALLSTFNITNAMPSFYNAVFELVVKGNKAYVLSYDAYLLILDISSITNVHVLSYLYRKSVISIDHLMVEENYVFALSEKPSLEIINSTTPSNLSLVSEFKTPKKWLDLYSAICKKGDYVFISSIDNGILVVNITDITNPVLLSNYSLENEVIYKMAIKNDALYALTINRKLMIFDISNPLDLRLIGEKTIGSGLSIYMALFIEGDFLYALTSSGVTIIDISNPWSPKIVSSISSDMYYFIDVFVKDNYAFVTSSNDYVLVIDVGEPESPHIIKTLDFGYEPFKLFVDGYYLFVASFDGVLHVYNASNIQNVVEVAYYIPNEFLSQNTFSTIFEIYVQGNYTFLAAGRGGVEVLYFPHVQENIIYVPWTPTSTTTSTSTTSSTQTTSLQDTGSSFLPYPGLLWSLLGIFTTQAIYVLSKRKRKT